MMSDKKNVNHTAISSLTLRTKALLMVSSFAMFAVTAQATETNNSFYAGAALSHVAAEDSGISTTDMGAAFIAGYTFSPYLSSEFSVFTIGDHKALGMKGNGISASIIGSYPVVDNISLFAELGAMSVDVSIDETIKPVALPSGEEDILQDGIDSSVYVSLGAKYQLSNWSIAMKMSLVDLDADLNILSLQANYHF